jgi:hypothetical protein
MQWDSARRIVRACPAGHKPGRSNLLRLDGRIR